MSTKEEPITEPILYIPSLCDTATGLSKGEMSTDVQLFKDMAVSLPESFSGTHDFMTAIIRKSDSAVNLEICLNDDIFTVITQEAPLAMFPVCTTSSSVLLPCSISAAKSGFLVSDIEKSPRMGLSSVAFPEINEDAHRWRGDQGLWDRLSYSTSGRIPQNWNDRTIDSRPIPAPKSAPKSALSNDLEVVLIGGTSSSAAPDGTNPEKKHSIRKALGDYAAAQGKTAM